MSDLLECPACGSTVTSHHAALLCEAADERMDNDRRNGTLYT